MFLKHFKHLALVLKKLRRCWQIVCVQAAR